MDDFLRAVQRSHDEAPVRFLRTVHDDTVRWDIHIAAFKDPADPRKGHAFAFSPLAFAEPRTMVGLGVHEDDFLETVEREIRAAGGWGLTGGWGLVLNTFAGYRLPDDLRVPRMERDDDVALHG